MKFKSTIPVIAACLAMSGASFAVAGEKQAGSSAKSYGAGTAAAGRDGAVATGVNGSDASATTRDRRAKRDRHERPEALNSATTHGSGAVYTTRRGASAAVTTGGTASGRGVQSTGSTVDAYAETNRDGSNADVYGDSVATSGERPK